MPHLRLVNIVCHILFKISQFNFVKSGFPSHIYFFEYYFYIFVFTEAVATSSTLWTLSSMNILFIAGLLGTLMNVASFFQVWFMFLRWFIFILTNISNKFLHWFLFLSLPFQIKYTSALTHNVSGTAKACVQSILAWIIYR